MDNQEKIRNDAIEKWKQVNSRLEQLTEFHQKYLLKIGQAITRKEVSIADTVELLSFLEKAENLLTMANTQLSHAKIKSHV